ncbi:MAG TPA: hypothetical protein VK582_10770 [Pyrinomonadaceae bacterium]|nr:hypothetical protein [Pyrinomonadaceae bacterium]
MNAQSSRKLNLLKLSVPFYFSPPLEKNAGTVVSTTEGDKDLTWMNGVWEGLAYQKNTNETWIIRLTVDKDRYSIAYPSFPCRGTLALIGWGQNVAKFREKITYGRCVDNGEVDVQRLNSSQIAFRYAEPGSTKIDSSATLDRVVH